MNSSALTELTYLRAQTATLHLFSLCPLSTLLHFNPQSEGHTVFSNN